MDADTLLHKIMSRRGPLPGDGRSHGRPWRGIVEETPAVWVNWITEASKRAGRPVPGAIRIDGDSGYSLRVPLVGVQLTYGIRYYFLAPCCGRRVEALYFLGPEVGCRKCLHLGYRSQVYRPGSAWLYMSRIYHRRSLWHRWEWPANVVMTEIVNPMRELLRAEIETMLGRVRVDDDEIDSGD